MMPLRPGHRRSRGPAPGHAQRRPHRRQPALL